MAETAPVLPERFEDRGLIGEGGMGEVREVYDTELDRVLAMKVLKPTVAGDESAVARFVEEAKITARLTHPGVVPVHDIGRLEDGRLYFTMQKVEGRTLRGLIRQVHGASTPRQWGKTHDGWSFRHLIDVYHKVCETVAYAHSNGLVHRDLKPGNILIGDFGEVLVMDWGLAVLSDTPSDKVGTVAGTPGYMAPEQARGEVHRIGPPTDVYALGGILYQILSGEPPPQGVVTVETVRGRVQSTFSFDDPQAEVDADFEGRELPNTLVSLSQKAMAPDLNDRYKHAGEVADEVGAWLVGARRREQALEYVARATELVEEAERYHIRAENLRLEAAALMQNVAVQAPEEHKAGAWAREDDAVRLEHRARVLLAEHARILHAGLAIDPELPEAHEALAERYRAMHAAAERIGDAAVTDRAEVNLRAHAIALPADHPARDRHHRYLMGNGALTLVPEVPKAQLRLLRYVAHNRRLVPELLREFKGGVTALELPMGSYLVEIRAEDRAVVRYPVHIARETHWDGIRPGDSEPLPIPLPTLDVLGPEDIYVPPGWCRTAGGEGTAHRDVWVDGFIIRRFSVRRRKYQLMLDALIKGGRESLAVRIAPTTRDIDPEAPVVRVDRVGAESYCRWRAAAAKRPWRLPYELEWEKAARGVDGRDYPWGDWLDPSWCSMRDSRPGARGPATVDSFPIDVSVYGVRGMAGNSADWCGDNGLIGPAVREDGLLLRPEAGDKHLPRVRRGGAWGADPFGCRVQTRRVVSPDHRSGSLGFRMCRSWPLETPPA